MSEKSPQDQCTLIHLDMKESAEEAELVKKTVMERLKTHHHNVWNRYLLWAVIDYSVHQLVSLYSNNITMSQYSLSSFTTSITLKLATRIQKTIAAVFASSCCFHHKWDCWRFSDWLWVTAELSLHSRLVLTIKNLLRQQQLSSSGVCRGRSVKMAAVMATVMVEGEKTQDLEEAESMKCRSYWTLSVRLHKMLE